MLPFETTGAIRLSEEVEADGAVLFQAARDHGLEGIIAKDRRSLYRPGRGGDWLKIKCIQSDNFMVVRYERSNSARGGIGSLLLAARRGDYWVYVGSVGTGLTEAVANDLRKSLDRIKRQTPPIVYAGRRKNLV